ncbi:MAG: EAL domain-containing protein [Acidimicrobiales bacterium]|nr:EAL domain-containing protein [Acidimicrobiales bacterium]
MHAPLGRREPWTAATVVLLVAGGALVAVQPLLPGAVLPAVLYDVLAAVGVVAVVAGVRVHRPAHPVPWLLIAAGFGLELVGDVVWDVLSLGLGVDPEASILPDLPYLGAYAFLFGGTLGLVRARRPGTDRSVLLGAGIASAVVGVLTFQFLAVPLLDQGGLSGFDRFSGSVYLAGSTAVVFAAVPLLRGRPRPLAAVVLLIAGLATLVVADLTDVSFVTFDVQTGWAWLSAAYLVAALLVGAAGVHPSMVHVTDALPARPDLIGLRDFVPESAALFVPAVILVGAQLQGHSVSVPALVVYVGTVAALAVFRVRLLLAQHERAEALSRAALADSEWRFRLFAENNTDVITRLDPAWNVLYVSPAVATVLGYEPDDVIGRPGWEFLHPDDLVTVLDRRDRLSRRADSDRLVHRMRRASGGWCWVETIGHAVFAADSDELVEFQMASRDVTSRIEAEEALAAHMALQDVVTGIAARFVDLDPGAVEAGIHEALALLGRHTGADRCYLFDYRAGSAVMDNTAEWCAPGVSSERQGLQGVPLAQLPRWVEQLASGEPVLVPRLRDLPTGWSAERAILEPQGIQSLAAVPMVLGGKVVGFVGFDSVVRERRWTSDEVALLRSAAGVFVAGRLRAEAERSRAATEQRLRSLLGALPDLVLRLRGDGTVVDVNDGRHPLLPPGSPVVGQPLGALFPALAEQGLDLAGARTRQATVVRDLVVGDRTAHVEVRVVGGDEPLLILRDVTEREHLEEALTRQALHDPLTGLPNRRLLGDLLTQALARAERRGWPMVLLYLDLDRFKVVNDTLGHAVGDAVLVETATRLEREVRGGDVPARVGGDEFVVVCEDVSARSEAEALALRLVEAFRAPFQVGGRRVPVTASVGYVLAGPGEGAIGHLRGEADADELLRAADAAMYRSKQTGRNRATEFDLALSEHTAMRVSVERDLPLALTRGELRLHFQPIVRLPGGEVVGAEALLRWEHPERGLLAPSAFLEVAEDTGLIVELGVWVLERAVREAVGWPRGRGAAGEPAALTVSVNLSTRQLADPLFAERVGELLDVAGLPAERLVLEITESTAMADPDRVQPTFERLAGLGVTLSIDDFGTGFSSLAQLRRLPVGQVKIDRSFVSGLGVDPADATLVAAVVDLAHRLGLTVVGEGVETPDQLVELARLGSDLAQGFLLGEPVPAATLRQRLLAEAAAPVGGRVEGRHGAT